MITSILLTQVMSRRFLVSFYARRALRIWPVYYLSLMILVLLNPFASGPGSLDGLPYFATFTQNIPYYWSDSTPAFIPAPVQQPDAAVLFDLVARHVDQRAHFHGLSAAKIHIKFAC